MLEHIQRMNKDNVTDSTMMDVWKKSKKCIYIFSSNVSVKVQKKGETWEFKMQRVILGKLLRSSFHTYSCNNDESLFTYPFETVSWALSCLDGAIRKNM